MKKIFFLTVFTIQFSLVGVSQDTLNHYTDSEVIELTNYIMGLEKKVAFYIATHPNDAAVLYAGNNNTEKAILVDILKDSLHSYSDNQIVKIVKYIKYLENLDLLNTIVLDAKKVVNDSTAKALALAASQKDLVSLLVDGKKELDKYEKLIFFNFDNSTLKEESYPALGEALKILKKYVNLTFVIEGHTDSVGTVEYNLNLSNNRAKSVRNYFVSKGIPSSRIVAIGYGKTKPIDTNETDAGRAKNRRVEIRGKK